MKLARLILLVLMLPSAAQSSEASRGPVTLGQIVDEIEAIDQMRAGLAAGIVALNQSAITEKTFEAVCKPVGMRLQQFAAKNGLRASQQSVKNRNPKNALDPKWKDDYRRFEKDSSLRAITRSDGTYLRRIQVEAACLKCHGEANDRPAFVVQKYPEDRAHGFRAGQLRGLYVIEALAR